MRLALTSVFDPVLCEVAYTWFCPKGGAILDPFCGGSVRGKDGCFKGLPNITQIIMKKNGFGLYDDFILIDPLGSASMRADKQFTATRKCVTTHQRFMVFLRGDPRKAKREG